MGDAMNEALDIAVSFIFVILLSTVLLIVGMLGYAAAKWVRTMWDEEV